MEVGIVGLGVAGISILREIKNQTSRTKHDPLHITVYSEKESFGTGFPYQPDDETLLINQYTETMSIDPENPYDFMDWVKEKKQMNNLKNTHLPRALFGVYLSEKSSQLLEELNVTVIYEKVIAVKMQASGQYAIETNNGSKHFDSVHLSVGHLAYQDPYNLKGNEKYIYNPYPATKRLKYENVPSTVGIIGTGLTAIDTFLYMRKHYPDVQLSFLSLDERFSSVRGHEPEVETHYFCKESILKIVTKQNQRVTLEQIRTWFEKETADHGIDLSWVWNNLGEGTVEGLQQDMDHLEELGRFQALIRKMRDCYALLWKALPDTERDLFLAEYGRKWSNFKAPIPQSTAKILIRTIESGDVQLLSRIKAISKEGGSFRVDFNNDETRVYDTIINASGQQMDLTRQLELQQPLVRDLIKEELLIPYPYGGVWIDHPSMCALDKAGDKIPGLYVYGQLASGVQFGNSNVELITRSTHQSVKDMLKS